MAYGVVRTDNLHGTDVRAAGCVSVKYIVTTGSGESAVKTETAIENGNVLVLGGLLEGEREVRLGTTPAADSDIKSIVLIASPEVMYDEHKKALDEFINEAGRICRGYRLHKGDHFSVTKACLDGVANPAVGDAVELKAGTKLNVAKSATSGSTQVGTIYAVETVGRYTYYVVEVA